MILASNSPQRKELIRYICDETRFLAVETDETFLDELDIYENIKRVATNKALAVVDEFNIDNEIVVSADTIVYRNGEVLLKPKDYDDAFSMIKSYENVNTEIISGVCICKVFDGNIEIKTFTDSSFVKFTGITDEKIKEWLVQDDYLGCSGAIKIERIQKLFNTEISGSIYNIIGLPLEKLSRELFHLNDDRFATLYEDEIINNDVRVRSATRVLPIKDGKVFVIKQKNFDGDIGYTLIGGGCTIEEDLLVGGKRELIEEAGFIIEELKPIGRSTILIEGAKSEQLGFKDYVINYHYICYGEILDIKEFHRLEYEMEMIDSIVDLEIDEAITLFKEQNENWKNAKNNFFHIFNYGVVEALETLKITFNK